MLIFTVSKICALAKKPMCYLQEPKPGFNVLVTLNKLSEHLHTGLKLKLVTIKAAFLCTLLFQGPMCMLSQEKTIFFFGVNRI